MFMCMFLFMSFVRLCCVSVCACAFCVRVFLFVLLFVFVVCARAIVCYCVFVFVLFSQWLVPLRSTGTGTHVKHADSLQITGGDFVENSADFGGFLFKEGSGNTSCSGASIERNIGVDGGGIYALDGASIDWQCDMESNYALSGCAM